MIFIIVYRAIFKFFARFHNFNLWYLYLCVYISDYLEQDTVKTLVKKYSQFINFNIFMWSSTTETVEEPIEEEEAEEAEKKEDEEKKEVSMNFIFHNCKI